MAEPRPEQAPPEEAVASTAPARGSIALATVALVLAAAALLVIMWMRMLIGDLRAEVNELKTTATRDEGAAGRLSRQLEAMGAAVTALTDQQVDLGNPALQRLRYGFAVSELKTTRQDKGVLVEGRVINGTSLSYAEATFVIKAGNVSKEFTIEKLAPGGSRAFEVVLPNVPMENARTATLLVVSSPPEYAR